MLALIRILSYSPGYLSILRILMTKKKNSVIRLIEEQSKYNLFKEQKGENKEQYYLKWTSTSDISTLFLDIVKVTEDVNVLMNWKLNFPQSFVICN